MSGARVAATVSSVLLAWALAGCGGPAHVGPEREAVWTAQELARLVTERVSGVRSFYDIDAGLRAGVFPLGARVFIEGQDRLRVQVMNPLSGDEVARMVLSDGEFLALDLRKNKGFRGDAAAVLAEKVPDIEIPPEALSPMKLFFPSFVARSGEESAMLVGRSGYVAEFWKPGVGPTVQVEVDAWSLTPVAMKLFRAGDVVLSIAWSGLTWCADDAVVVPFEVALTFPGPRKTVRISLSKPKINKPIEPRAFRLQEPPGVDVEEVGARAGGTDASGENAE